MASDSQDARTLLQEQAAAILLLTLEIEEVKFKHRLLLQAQEKELPNARALLQKQAKAIKILDLEMTAVKLRHRLLLRHSAHVIEQAASDTDQEWSFVAPLR